MSRKIPLYAKILIGMAFGLLFGFLVVLLGLNQFASDYIKPFGVIFLNLLKLIAMPLIFASLVSGIGGLKDISSLSKLGLKTVSLYIVTTIIAVSIGLTMVSIISPGSYLSQEKKAEYLQRFSNDITEKQKVAESLSDNSPLQFLVDIVPENVVEAASNNTSMLQVIFFAILFGVALILAPKSKVRIVKDFVDGLNEVILKIVDIIMHTAPFGVFALMVSLLVDFVGDDLSASAQLFGSLGLYALTVVLGLALIAGIIYPTFLKFYAGISFKKFYRAIFPAQLVAFSTSSSAATLPVTMEQVENELNVPNEVSSFVLPIGVTINMDGTSLYQAVATVFIAEVFGVELTFVQLLTILITATLASIGSAGVPGAGIVMLIIVLNSVGLPVEGLALILAIDRPLDMLRTSLNVTGDSMIATVVAKSEGMLGK
ncbi:dicarboxylate/amino acid:cation symporter [Tenuifilum thalassicum]|uniref:Dicarboxylate/amino acid:cation symporter n=1 Tax=Tenuifilum thalassicum TaxID=2590900 RepID=A0A7D4BEE1_9BACT|nr:dicarboxylate/amino acid:cation symporter [Tenuifilum thalassicum]QKG79938.1 dicarboxylate/amino acid:cation symporter [Tenuifilum thalassicum]